MFDPFLRSSDNPMTTFTPAGPPSSFTGSPITPPSQSPSHLRPPTSLTNTGPSTRNVVSKDMSGRSPPHTGGPSIHSSPIKHKLSGSQSYSNSPPSNAVQTRALLAAETQGHYIGPIPPKVFLGSFLSWKGMPTLPKCDDIASKFNHEPASSEKAMFDALVCTSRFV